MTDVIDPTYDPEGSAEEDMIESQPWLAYCWAAAFGVMIGCVLALTITICAVFRKRPRHRSYLLFFAYTSFGILLLFLDRITGAFGTHIIRDEWANWIWYIFGQSLTVSGELVRAGRLIVICYGYPSIRGWVHPGSVNVRYLTTAFMSGTVLVLNIPVLIMYLVLTFTQSVIADYVAVAYYCLLIAVMMLFTFKLWQKRGQLKQHQLSETKTLVIYGATLAFYVIFDNVRYYGFPDEMYGENASIWVTIDFVSFCCLSVVVLFIWARNIFIMWDRENNGSGHTTAGENTDRALGEEGTPIQNKWRRGRIDNATIDDVRYDTRLVPSSRVELEGDKVGGGTKDIDTLVKDHINAGIREKETDIEAGEASGDDGSGEDLTLNVSMTSAPWLRDRRDL